MLNGPKERAQLTGKFSLLCRDQSEEVRKSAAEAIVALSEVNDPVSRLVTVVPAARLLLNDASAAVRSLTTRNLGPLIASIGANCDAVIVNKFSAALSSTDLGLCFSAAYAFPAVARVLGQKRFSELAPGFEAVVNSPEYRVRRSIAYGLFEYASVIPPQELSDAVSSFLKDIPTVAIGIFANLNCLLPILSDHARLIQALENPQGLQSWRARFEISKQLLLCQPFFDRSALLKIAQTLVTDSVWKVRRDAALSVATLMEEADLLFLIRLAKNGNARERISAAWIIKNMKFELLIDVVIERLRALLRDSVANVRAAAARAVAPHAVNVPAITELAQSVTLDEDPDVREIETIGLIGSDQTILTASHRDD
jgi:HEAT repeat protein